MERRHIVRACELRKDGKRLSGYAACFYRAGDPETEFVLWPGFVERILPGAFEGAWKDTDPVALFNHDERELLGRLSSKTLRLRVDDVGLHYDVDLARTRSAEDVREHVRRGDVSGSSFAFLVRSGGERIVNEGDVVVREILAVKLFDVGPVISPAYAATSASTRGAGELEDGLLERLEAARDAEIERLAESRRQVLARAAELRLE